MAYKGTPPPGLSPESAAAWPGYAADVAAALGGAAVDYLVLADFFLARDRLAQVRAVLDAEGLTVAGSKGQSRPHPLLAVECALRRETADALKRLGLDRDGRGRLDVVVNGRLKKRYG